MRTKPLRLAVFMVCVVRRVAVWQVCGRKTYNMRSKRAQGTTQQSASVKVHQSINLSISPCYSVHLNVLVFYLTDLDLIIFHVQLGISALY